MPYGLPEQKYTIEKMVVSHGQPCNLYLNLKNVLYVIVILYIMRGSQCHKWFFVIMWNETFHFFQKKKKEGQQDRIEKKRSEFPEVVVLRACYYRCCSWSIKKKKTAILDEYGQKSTLIFHFFFPTVIPCFDTLDFLVL